LNRFTTLITLCLIGAGSAALYLRQDTETMLGGLRPEAGTFGKGVNMPTLSGNYLKTRYAQQHHDWSEASRFMEEVLAKQPKNPIFLKRAMVLAMGAGDTEKALAHAEKVSALHDKESALSQLFLALGAFKKKQYEQAALYIHDMPSGGLSDFIMPLLHGWTSAALGQDKTAELDKNSIHMMHAILIADYLKKPREMDSLLKKALRTRGFDPQDMERLGDVYTQAGHIKEAHTLYSEALKQSPDNTALAKKLTTHDKTQDTGQKTQLFSRISTPEEGVAEALYDMARLLAQEYSDESARIFAEMALYLNPDMTHTHFLIAHIAARNEHYDEAIAAYRAIAPEDPAYEEARRTVADLLADQDKTDEARKELLALTEKSEDLQALIQLGDLYRLDDKFSQAIETYNKVEAHFGGTLPAEYWHVHYLRGMAYEQNNEWKKAEADLEAALKFQPDHPYVLNYLGYAWADKGEHLDQALFMIEKAATLRPEDGYITDSLGWVFYRLGRYAEAVPHLEQAVELMPYDPTVNDHLGDAYWQTGRKIEARFQWERAKNAAKDATLIKDLDKKLEDGLVQATVLKDAKLATP